MVLALSVFLFLLNLKKTHERPLDISSTEFPMAGPSGLNEIELGQNTVVWDFKVSVEINASRDFFEI